MNHHPRVAAMGVAVVLCLFLATGCARKAGDDISMRSAPRNPGGSGTADVTWKPGVHVIEQHEGLDALISVSTDGSTLVFDRRRGGVPIMKDGDVFLIKGLLARKVVASESNDDELAVLTVPAGLVDLVSDAKIRVHAPIRFGRPQGVALASPWSPSWRALGDAIVPSAYAQSPVEERRKAAEQNGRGDAFGNLVSTPFKAAISGWDTEFSATPADGRLNLSLKMKKSVSGVAAIVSGEGYLADFDFDGGIDVERSTVERMQLGFKKLNGVMNFKWVVQTTEDGKLRGNARIKLPTAVEIPLYQYLGGLPLYLEISSAVIIKPALGAQYEFSHGEFRVTYDGYQNFSAKEGTVDADGNVSGDIKLIESNSGSGAPIGMVVAFAAPRIELSIGVSKILKFDGIKEAAEKADKYFDKLVTKAFGAEALEKFKSSPMSKVTGKNIADAAMGSDAAAFIELVTTSGMSHTGTAVMVPCTRTDLHMSVKVGASAHAFGQGVGDVDKEIFKKDVSRVRPSENALCNNI
jgi:hypothetical protein